MKRLVINLLLDDRQLMAARRVFFVQFGTNLRTRFTARARQITGHSCRRPDLCWVRESNLSPFFWSSKRIRTHCDFLRRSGSSWGTSTFPLSKNRIPPSLIGLVFPALDGWVNSQERIAKKKPPPRRSAAWSALMFLISGEEKCRRYFRNLGVMAFCRRGSGEWFFMAVKRSLKSDLKPAALPRGKSPMSRTGG